MTTTKTMTRKERDMEELVDHVRSLPIQISNLDSARFFTTLDNTTTNTTATLDDLFTTKSSESTTFSTSHTRDLFATLLNHLGYKKHPSWLIEKARVFPADVDGSLLDLRTMVCLTDGVDCFLVVVESEEPDNNFSKTSTSSSSVPSEAESILIASAISAFRESNQNRILSNLPTHTSTLLSGIIVHHHSSPTTFGNPIAAPVFYRIPVSQELVSAFDARSARSANLAAHVGAGFNAFHANVTCRRGVLEEVETVLVQKFIPGVDNQARYLVDGMESAENRRLVLSCLEKFRDGLGDTKV